MFVSVCRKWLYPRSLYAAKMPLADPKIETRGEPLWLDAAVDFTEVRLSQIHAAVDGTALATSGLKILRILIDERAEALKLRRYLLTVRESSPGAVFSFGLPIPARVASVSSSDVRSFEVFRNFQSFALAVSSLQINWVASYHRLQKKIPISWRTNRLHQTIGVPELTVIIPHHRDFKNLQKVLDQLERQQWGKSRQFEVIVVDNAVESELLTPTEAAEILQRDLALAFISLTSPDRRLYLAGQARNEGIGKARGRKILFLDSDIALPVKFLGELCDDLESADVVMAKRYMLTESASRKLASVSGIHPHDTYAQDAYWENFNRRAIWAEGEDYWKYACTYCLAVKTELIERAGLFDGHFTMYGFEDVDLAFRFFKLGMKFKFARSPCYHLFPVRREHCYHLEGEKRENSLRAAALTFFLLRPERLTFVSCQHYFAPTLIKWVAHQVRSSLQLRRLERNGDARTS